MQYLFSAILGRDQVYQNVLDQGMVLGLSWGSDITGTDRPKDTAGTDRPKDTARTKADKSSGASIAKELDNF